MAVISGMRHDIESLESEYAKPATKPLAAKVTAKKGKGKKRMLFHSDNSDSNNEYVPKCKLSSSPEF